MTTTPIQLPATRSRRTQARRVTNVLSTLVVALVALVLVWQAVSYRGLMAFLAEWQFNAFGHYYPALTYILLIGVLALPLYLIGLFRHRRSRRRARLYQRSAAPRALRFARILIGVAIGLAGCALVALAMTRVLPDAEGVPVAVTVAQPTVPPIGPATLAGVVIYDRTAALDESLWSLGRNVRFAPVVAPGQSTRHGRLRYFVELRADDLQESNGAPRRLTGILRQGGLPGELIQLYRYAGYTVEAPYYVLFTSRASLTWPNRTLAIQFTVGALIFLIAGLLQLGHHRRLVRADTRATELETPPATVVAA